MQDYSKSTLKFMHRRFRFSSSQSSCLSEVSMKADCSPRSSISESLYQQSLEEHYTIQRKLGSGTYGKVLLCRCRRTDTTVALKVLPKPATKLKDFLREFNYSYYLSPHRAILDTFDVAFETPTSYVFAQEYASRGDLFDAITPQIGMSETHTKNMAKQLSSALEFMHSKQLVHRDIKPENILVFDDEFCRVKLMDFGMTKKAGTMVRKVSTGIPYTPPEVCEALKGERYAVEAAADVWAFAVLMFCTLTGNFPWELAHNSDLFYTEFSAWQKRKCTRSPSQWRRFTPRLMRLFRRLLEPRPEKRCAIKEVLKYLDDDWIVTVPRSTSQGNEANSVDTDPMSDINEMLERHGIETKVSKKHREKRIHEWVTSSPQASATDSTDP